MKNFTVYVAGRFGTASLGRFTDVRATSKRAAIRSVKATVRQLTDFHACDYTYVAEEVGHE